MHSATIQDIPVEKYAKTEIKQKKATAETGKQPESPKGHTKNKSDISATLPPLTVSQESKNMNVTEIAMRSSGSQKKRKRSTSSDRKHLPKASENLNLTLDKFVGSSVISIDE